MENTSLGLSFAQSRFDEAVKRLNQESSFGVPSVESRSIYMGEIEAYGMYLAAAIDANQPPSENELKRRRELWSELNHAKNELNAAIIGAHDYPIGHDPSVHRGERRVMAAWIALSKNHSA